MEWIDDEENHQYRGDISPSKDLVTPADQGSYYLLTSSSSGALVCVVCISEDESKDCVSVTRDDPYLLLHGSVARYRFVCVISELVLTNPNDIGPSPQPTASRMIPVDSPRVMVACGTTPSGNYITREQYWRRTSDSYALAPGQKHTVGFSTTSGMEQTSSTQEAISQQLGLSASAGWGPISTSVSASLSKNSTTFQQVTISTETTRYETAELVNTTPMSV